MQSLKVLLFCAISGMLFQAYAIDEVPHKPAAQEKTEDVKGSITPATAEQQQQLEEEIKKVKQKGETKKPKKQKKNKKESKKPKT